MATSMSQCCYLLFKCSGISPLLIHRWINQTITSHRNFAPGCTRNGHCLHQSVGYGNKAGDNAQDGQVTIPVDRLTVSYSRSSGPGGQHVNKVSSKAEVRFHIHTAEWIPDDVKQNIILNNKNRINKAGELLVTSELSRNQHRNLGDCIKKISDIIAEASRKPHEPSAEDIALRASRLERRNKERLQQKKINSATKLSRRVDFD